MEHGNDEQRERFVRPTLVGDIAWCQLFSEPGAGSDLASLRTKATKVDGGWSLSGPEGLDLARPPGRLGHLPRAYATRMPRTTRGSRTSSST